MNRLDKSINELAKRIGFELCEKWAETSKEDICGLCPYSDKCGYKQNALVEEVKNIINEYLKEE